MPKLEQTVTVEVEVAPEVLVEAEALLRAYDELDQQMAACREQLAALAAQAGVRSLKVENVGTVIQMPESESWRLDRKKLLTNGVLLSTIEKSQTKVTRKAHTQVRLSRKKDEGEQE